ncbi:hypothetical protein [Lacticaseibacillus mingshuiensis]|uniref:Uncharacterized protein n=1 Tax=Lacticaseibacillus mingshuiensis TaxID=2799574 RepID=A0ABW4CME1_9LACO|nr:hypothetical protein [Lacticaseibacillus mingshuiensis]
MANDDWIHLAGWVVGGETFNIREPWQAARRIDAVKIGVDEFFDEDDQRIDRPPRVYHLLFTSELAGLNLHIGDRLDVRGTLHNFPNLVKVEYQARIEKTEGRTRRRIVDYLVTWAKWAKLTREQTKNVDKMSKSYLKGELPIERLLRRETHLAAKLSDHAREFMEDTQASQRQLERETRFKLATQLPQAAIIEPSRRVKLTPGEPTAGFEAPPFDKTRVVDPIYRHELLRTLNEDRAFRQHQGLPLLSTLALPEEWRAQHWQPREVGEQEDPEVMATYARIRAGSDEPMIPSRSVAAAKALRQRQEKTETAEAKPVSESGSGAKTEVAGPVGGEDAHAKSPTPGQPTAQVTPAKPSEPVKPTEAVKPDDSARPSTESTAEVRSDSHLKPAPKLETISEAKSILGSESKAESKSDSVPKSAPNSPATPAPSSPPANPRHLSL